MDSGENGLDSILENRHALGNFPAEIFQCWINFPGLDEFPDWFPVLENFQELVPSPGKFSRKPSKLQKKILLGLSLETNLHECVDVC
jgi:hypothetical protein